MTSRRAERRRRKAKAKNYRCQHIAGADRRVENLPVNALVRAVVVPDPYEAGGTITVIASIRDDPLGRLHDRGRIDDAQFKAGREYQRLYETAAISGVKAMDTTKEPVDGGNLVPDPYNDAKLDAAKHLAYLDREVERELGNFGVRLCRDVLIERMFLKQLAESRGVPPTDRWRDYLGKRVRECLEILAVSMTCSQPRRTSS